MAANDLPAKSGRFMLLCSICLIVAVLYFAQTVLIPILLAVLITFLLGPLVVRLERWKVPRVVAVFAVVLCAMGLVTVIGWIVARQVMDLATELPQYRQTISEKLAKLPGRRGSVIRDVRQTVQALSKDMAGPATQPRATTQATAQGTTQPVEAPQKTPAQAFADDLRTGAPIPVETREPTQPLVILQEWVGKLLSPLGTAGIVVIFVIFMLLSREDLRDRLIRLIGQGELDVTTQALTDAGNRISRYLGMQTCVNTGYGIAVAVGLFLIGHFSGRRDGFPNFVLLGLLAGLFRFLPYIGPWLGASLPVILSIAVFPSAAPFFYTIGLFVALETINNSFLEPTLYGASTGLSTVAILAAAVFWTWLWGPIGLLLSTPLTVCLVVIGKHVPSLQFLEILLGDEPVLPPPVRIYQRLLARDAEEAMDLTHEYRKQMPLEKVYEDVLVPAVAMAAQDHARGRLDEAHTAEVYQAVREMVEELGELERQEIARSAASVSNGASVAPAVAAGTAPSLLAAVTAPLPSDPNRVHLPADCVANVVIAPSRGAADELVGSMLAQLLEFQGYCAVSLPTNKLVSEIVEAVETKKADVIVVSALPPSAATHARYLCKRLRAKYEKTPIVVGLWTRPDLEQPTQRIAPQTGAELTNNFTDAMQRIHQRIQPTIVERTTA